MRVWMPVRSSWRPLSLPLALALALVSPALGQTTGMIKGRVVDDKGQPVDGATISIESIENSARKFETKTNRKGEYIQIGLQSGTYRIKAEKKGVGTQSFDKVPVKLAAPAEVNFALANAGASTTADAFRKGFEEGVQLNAAGNYDGAIAKFEELLAANPACYQCQHNIGAALVQKKEYEKAEAALKKAIEMKADYAPSYTALANLYNTTRRFDEAAQASAEAAKIAGAGAGGGDPDTIYNQGVILWNAGKIADAKKQFEETVKVKPDHAEAHYWLGMANLNEGKMPEAATEFEEYLKLAPTGQFAAQAKGVLGQIKK